MILGDIVLIYRQILRTFTTAISIISMQKLDVKLQMILGDIALMILQII